MSKLTGLLTDFHKMAILFDLLFEVKSTHNKTFNWPLGYLLISDNLNSTFQTEPTFQFSKQFNISIAFDII